MNRFFLDSHLFAENCVKFPEAIAHQILNVLRLGSGDEVEVLDNQGFVYRIQLKLSTDKKELIGKILDKETVRTEPNVIITLCFGLTSRDKVELILQKGTEIGVTRFIPFISSRTLVQTTELSDKKKARWERIIREAAEQSQRGRLPELASPQSFEGCLSTVCAKNDLSLIAWESVDSDSFNLKESLDQLKGSSAALFVGPEGGFSNEEIGTAKEAGCRVISLGKRILRTETAAVVFPAVVLYELGEM